MKTLSLLLLFLIAAQFTSCAHNSKPPLWYDKYGILHNENPDPGDVHAVKIVRGYYYIPNGCVRLRNMYFEGTTYLDYDLKLETAKQGGTHVNRTYINNRQDTLGVAYDCSNRHHYNSVHKLQKNVRRNMAIGELERRTFIKGNNKERKPSQIPRLDE